MTLDCVSRSRRFLIASRGILLDHRTGEEILWMKLVRRTRASLLPNMIETWKLYERRTGLVMNELMEMIVIAVNGNAIPVRECVDLLEIRRKVIDLDNYWNSPLKGNRERILWFWKILHIHGWTLRGGKRKKKFEKFSFHFYFFCIKNYTLPTVIWIVEKMTLIYFLVPNS